MSENLINWNDSYSVGNAEMDEQHKKLIEIINKLFKSFKEGNAQDILSEILNEMIDYSNYHLNSEEKLLFKHDYPEKDNHEAIHQEFRDKIDELKLIIQKKDEGAHYKLIEYLKNWWTNHILIEDMKYSDFFANKS